MRKITPPEFWVNERWYGKIYSKEEALNFVRLIQRDVLEFIIETTKFKTEEETRAFINELISST